MGERITISAPGDKVWRAYIDEKTHRTDLVGPRFGTSFAVSLTAGAAALWLAHHGRAALIDRYGRGNLQQVFRDALVRTADKPDHWEDHRKLLGAGIVNAKALLKENLVS